MPKLTLTDLASLENQSSAISIINANNTLIEAAIEDALLLSGSGANEMADSLDMNDNRILNLPAPTSDTEPLRLIDAESLEGTTLTINNNYTPATLTTVTPATGDLFGFADISDSNATRAATLGTIVAKGIETSLTTGTATITTANITGGTATALTITTGTIPTLNATNVDAGASGTAGSVDVFPTTASKGKLTLAATDNTGNTTTTITNAAQADTRTYTIPDAGASASFVMSAGTNTISAAQTLSGINTYSTMFRIPYNGSVAAAGSVQGDAAALSEGLSVVTGANGTLGVRLPTAVAGAIVIIKGTTAGVLKVWPATGAAINALGSNNSMSFASGAVPAIIIATSSTQWYTFPLLPS
jgi:hypothetical protein